MKAHLVIIFALVACNQIETVSQDAGHQMPQMASAPSNLLDPVVDTSAPTVGQLAKQGLVRIDDEPFGWSCGKDCTADGFSAIYLGRLKAKISAADREYVCPVTDGEMDSWKCRRMVKS